jgi:hypothetical protein
VAQRVVLAANPTLDIPFALRTARPNDYDTATLDWPAGVNGQPR